MTPYFSIKKNEAILRQSVTSWMGTPFISQTAIKGVGCDCVRFAGAIMEEAGAIEKRSWPDYAIRGGGEATLEMIRENLEKIPGLEEIDKADSMLGDVLLYSTGRALHHFGIDLGEDRFSHCLDRYGVTQACLSDPTFSTRLLSRYRFFI